MVAVAMVGGAVLTAGVGAYSANQAAGAQKSAANNATRAEMQRYEEARSDLSPYRQAGQGALSPLNNMLTGSPEQMQQQMEQLPGYQFVKNQGLQAVQSSAAARGLGTSGAALRGAADYTTGLANSTYGDQVNRLMGLAQIGGNAAAQTGNFGIQTGQSVGSNMLGAGNAAAAGAIGVGNAIGGAANNIGQMYMMNALMKNSGGQGLFH